MCGLVALISPGVPIADELLITMRDRLEHRGPDSAGLWIDPSKRIGLGHRRLSIIDRSAAANQPMVSGNGHLTLVYNGEIYNYIELREELARLGYRFKTRSDTEVLLAAYQVWGEAALPRLNGMFAFAIWDDERRQLFVARDRFGEKPLFIGRGRHGVVAVASEMKAILAHPLIPQSVSEDAMVRFGESRWREDDACTFFEHIERLPPSHAAVFDSQGRQRRKWRYWTPDYTNIRDDLTADEAREEFDALFARSIVMRMRSDVPLGSSLSGGLDSSTIVAELAKHREQENFSQNVFSACFPDDPTLSEEADIDLVVEHTGVQSFRVNPSTERLMADARKLHWHQEEPFMSASIFLQWVVADLVKQHDVIVLLDGQGADEVLAGYQSLFPLYQMDLVDRGLMDQAIADTRLFTQRLQAAAANFADAKRRFDPNIAYTEEELLELQGNMPNVWHNGYTPGTPPAQPGYRMRRVLSETLQYNGLPMLLRYADRNAMAFSREPRTPYLDYDLVDYCISLPDEYLIRDGWQKWVLREAAAKRLPDAIAWRGDKVGYAAPLDHWLKGDLKSWAAERIFDEGLSDCPGYEKDAMQTLWQQHQTGDANNSWAIWQWASLSEWRDLHRAGYWRCGF